jgi:cytochrome c oxidase assembly factor CtaG
VDVAFSHWSASWPVLIAYVLLAASHLAGASRGGGTRQERLRAAVLCQLGLAVIALALVSPVGYWSGTYIWVRAVQELLVAVVGPGLIVLGAPWAAFRLRPAWLNWIVARPVVAVIAANVVWLGWQLPVLYDAGHGSAGLALAEHVSYLAAGIVFWLQLISSRPITQQTPPLRRIALLVSTVGAWTVLGMVLVFGSGVLYPVYANSAHHVVTVVDDQQLAGAILWMGMLPPLIIAGVALLMQWFSNEESAELAAGLDRLLAPPRPHGWPSRPVIR